MVFKNPKMNKLFKGQISFRAVFSKCAQARYYHGILAATELYDQKLIRDTTENERIDNSMIFCLKNLVGATTYDT